jgi:crotonobetainyl-CoA:carnitine CoA-transferase CaiB-like acyl-CoA transferase
MRGNKTEKIPVEFRTTESALLELSEELGISESDMDGNVTFEGKDPLVASKHHLGDSTATLLALFGMELAAIWKHRTGKGQDVKVHARNAICNLAAMLYATQNGMPIFYDDFGMVETTDFFRCKDGRWVFIVCSLPHLRQLACEVLDCQATRETFVERCMQWNAAELEEAMADVGASCAMVRTREEWFASEQSQYTMQAPLISIEKIGDSAPIPFTPNPDMPLSGIRIIDNTHIYAGPICARYASDAGADVLHTVPPLLPNPPKMDAEVMPGKRSAWCDLTNPAMQEQFWKLVKGADVWVNSFLHLDRKGISPQQLAAVKAGIICVEYRCYGFTGPWAERGGFEQHGQCVTGFNVNEGSMDSPRTAPTYLLNDVQTGLEGAIGMFEALRRRAKEGGSYLVRVALARSCSWMQDFGLFDASDVFGVGLPEALLSGPGLGSSLRPEFALPLVTSTGPLGEMSVLPPQLEFSEIKLGPRFSGDPNGASKLDWSVFSTKNENKAEAR